MTALPKHTLQVYLMSCKSLRYALHAQHLFMHYLEVIVSTMFTDLRTTATCRVMAIVLLGVF